VSGWTEDHARAAREDGWQLRYTWDVGKPLPYLAVYPYGPKLSDPYRATQHVIAGAQLGQKTHLHALQCIAHSRVRKK
jgi:hypothetical protein